MIEMRPSDGVWPHHAVDVVVVAGRDDRLDLAVVHGAVFQVEPDAVVTEMGGIADEEGQVMPGGADAGELPAAEFGQDLAFSHE